MTRAGALLWKEWRDHRAALAVFAALVPLVSWPTQKYVLKFNDPTWTWQYVVPICVAPCVAVVAADSFAMDLATSRMSGFAALPVPLRRHFSIRTLFLALVGIGIAVWSGAVNVAIAAMSPKAGYAAQMLDAIEPSAAGFAGIVAVTAAVLVFSALGVGGFRAAIGGALLAGLAWFATDFVTDTLSPLDCTFWEHQILRNSRVAIEWCVAAAVLGIAAYAAFARSRALPQLRRRGVVAAAAILVGAFGLPASAATWKVYRAYTITPDDPAATVGSIRVSPDDRHVAIVMYKPDGRGDSVYRSWIARTDGTAVFDWPRRNDYVQGWSDDGLVCMLRVHAHPSESGALVDPESGETVVEAGSDAQTKHVVRLRSSTPRWGHWLRWAQEEGQPRDVSGGHVWDWRVLRTDSKVERFVVARSMPAPTPKAGEVLIATADAKLCVVDLEGGEPRVVAEGVLDIPGWYSGSPDGRYYIVGTAEGRVVLDSQTWKPVAGPFDRKGWVFWGNGSESRALLCVVDGKTQTVHRFVDVATGREIAVDASLELAREGFGSGVHVLADGTIVAQSGLRGVVLLDADGKLVRRLFPPQD